MNHRTMQLQEAVDEATDTMRAASQALTLMEGTAAEEEELRLKKCAPHDE